MFFLQIWLGFKDYCNQNLDLYVKNIEARDSKMVKYINDYAKKGWVGNPAPIAVTSGASLGKRPYEQL
jgi:hypothetical protein